MPRPTRRAELLEAASRRFYRDGIGATGVDTLAAAAGVAKMTLYSNYGSKDGLVLAYLEERDRRFFALLDEAVEARTDAVERVLAVVDVYARYLAEPGFRGCAFLNAAAELPLGHPGRDVVTRHKQQVLERWTDLIAAAGISEPHALARECHCLLEGAFVRAGVGLDGDDLAEARRLIRRRLTHRAAG